MSEPLARKIVQLVGLSRLRGLFAVLDWLKPGELQVTLALAGLVGFLGGLASIAFRRSVQAVHWVFTQHWGPGVTESFAHLPPWQRVAVPIVGGAAGGLMLMMAARFAKQKRTTDYMEAVVVGNGMIPVRQSLFKSLSALFSIASGASIGREGPMVQLSAMLASLVGRGTRATNPRLRLLVACGAAAGIASAYNAPISGALFVAEIVLGTTSMEIFGPLIFASVVGTLTVRQIIGSEAIYHIGNLPLGAPTDLIFLLGLGILCGVLSHGYLWTLRRVEGAFAQWPAPPFLRLAAGGAVVGVIAIWYPQVCGNGYSSVEAVLHGAWPWQELAVVMILKIVATSAAFGSGAVGGVFTPTLFVGSAIGFLSSVVFQHLFGLKPDTAITFALVGMGAFLAASTRAPILAIILIFELTLDYEIILPLMLACVTGYYAARSLRGEGLYSETLRRKGRWEFDSQLRSMRVGDIMRANPPTVGLGAPFDEVCEKFTTLRHNYLYVTGPQNQFSGVISLHDVKRFLADPDLAKLVIARDLVREKFPSLRRDDYLSTVFERFARHESERLPVLSESGILLGSVSKADALLAFAEQPNRPES